MLLRDFCKFFFRVITTCNETGKSHFIVIKMAEACEEDEHFLQLHKYKWKDRELLSLLSDSAIPETWDSEKYPLTYSFLKLLFDFSSEVVGKQDELILTSLICLYGDSLILPSSFKNSRRKVFSYLKKHNDALFRGFETEKDKNYVGCFSSKIGLNKQEIQNILTGGYSFTFPPGFTLTNGIVLELAQLKNCERQLTWEELKYLINFFLSYHNTETSVDSLRHMLNLLSKNKNKLRGESLKSFLTEEFEIHDKNSTLNRSSSSINCDDDFSSDLMTKINIIQNETKLLAERLIESNEKVAQLTECLKEESTVKLMMFEKVSILKKENENLSKKLYVSIKEFDNFSSKNLNRKFKRKDKKISDLKNKNVELSKRIEDLESVSEDHDELIEAVNNSLKKSLDAKTKAQKLKWYYKTIVDRCTTDSFEDRIKILKEEVKLLETEKLESEEKLNEFINGTINLKYNGRYNDNVRAVYQDLVLSGVGVNNVQKIVETVLKNIVGVDVKCLPGSTFAKLMFIEARRLAQIQVAETLIEDFDQQAHTLHSDGTSKFGRHFGTFDVTTTNGQNMVLGINEMSSGDTETQFSSFKSLLTDLEECINDDNFLNKAVCSIKNVMSDRHIVQKNFNKVLQEYRTSVLPSVKSNWNELSELEKSKLSTINQFFCGMHFIVGLADIAESSLKTFDQLLYDGKAVGSLAKGGYSRNGESGTVRLVRTLCKAVQTRGCEKSGRIQDFSSFLNDLGFQKDPFIPFRGNRFNVVFYNGGISYFMHQICRNFFENVKDDNKLLNAVFYDLQVDSFIAGCRALGIISKIVTGPLWRLLESKIHILDLSNHFQRMERLFSAFAVDAQDVLDGGVIFFEGVDVKKDCVYDKLFQKSELYDKPTLQCLELLFGSFSIITKRMLHDHLEDGLYDNVTDANLRKETSAVPKTNTVAERDFGMLDRLMREKPNANLITLESVIMCQTNKMSLWRDNLDNEKRAKLMEMARKSKDQQYQIFKNKRVLLRQQISQKRTEKIECKKEKERKVMIAKEKLVLLIEEYGGLWKSPSEVDEKVAHLKGDKVLKALKVQLQFRQKVLSQPGVDKSLYFFTEAGKNKNLDCLINNLKKIIRFAVTGDEEYQSEEVEMVSVVDIERLEVEKKRLKGLVEKESDKILSKSRESKPVAKKRKIEKKKYDNERVPVVAEIDELVGKFVEHLTQGYKGEEKWFEGVVVCRKPDCQNDLVIRYDCEPDTLFSFTYDEFLNGSVVLLSLEPAKLIGKKIEQRFTNEDGSESWWETGVIIGFEEKSESDVEFVVNFFEIDDDVDDLNDDFLNVYEVCTFPLIDDYLNNDIRLL